MYREDANGIFIIFNDVHHYARYLNEADTRCFWGLPILLISYCYFCIHWLSHFFFPRAKTKLAQTLTLVRGSQTLFLKGLFEEKSSMLRDLPPVALTLCGHVVHDLGAVRNIGVTIDRHLSFGTHIRHHVP